MVAAAFADEGIVQILKKKMKLCKETQKKAIRSGTSKVAAAGGEAAAVAAAAAAVAARKELGAPSSPTSAAKDTQRGSPLGEVGRECGNNGGSMSRERTSSARPLDGGTAHELPCGRLRGLHASANSAQRKLGVRGCDDESTKRLSRAVIPMFAIDPRTMPSDAPVPPGLDRCKREGADEHTPLAVCTDGGGDGCLESQRRPVTTIVGAEKTVSIEDGAERGLNNADDAAAKKGHGRNARHGSNARGQKEECSPLLAAGRHDHPSPSSRGIGNSDGLGTLARNEQPHEERRHRVRDCTGDLPRVTRASTTTPRSVVVGVNSTTLAEGGEATAAAVEISAGPPPTGVLVENKSDSGDEECELGMILASFERQLERGAALVRGCEEAPHAVAERNDDGEAGNGNERPESECAEEVSISSSSIVCGEDSHFSGASSNDGVTVPELEQREATSEAAGELRAEIDFPEIVASDVERKLEGLARNSEIEDATHPSSVSGTTVDARREVGGNSVRRSLLAAPGELKPPPDTATTEDEDDDDYDFTFDDEELVPGRKTVQFTDESGWSVHEVRESFQQHELGELFYTTAELDVMQEEAEMEEALERSKSVVSQKKDALGNGGGSCLLYSGDKSVQKRGVSIGDIETASSSESLSFEFEGSEYSF